MKADIEAQLKAVWQRRKELLQAEEREEDGLAFLAVRALRSGTAKNAVHPTKSKRAMGST